MSFTHAVHPPKGDCPPRILILLSCFLLALAIGLPVRAATSAESARKPIQAIFNRVEAAYKKRDAKAIRAVLTRYFTPDFTRRLPDGTMTDRKKLLADPARDLSRLDSVSKAETRILKLSVQGPVATALARSQFVGAMTDVHKITLKLDNRATSLFSFVKTPEGWKAKREAVLSQEFRVNDKLIRSTPHIPKPAPQPSGKTPK